MKPRIAENDWRQASGRVAYAWHKNPWIVSHLLGPQAQQTLDAGCALAVVDVAQALPLATAGSPSRPRQPVGEGVWETQAA